MYVSSGLSIQHASLHFLSLTLAHLHLGRSLGPQVPTRVGVMQEKQAFKMLKCLEQELVSTTPKNPVVLLGELW